MRCTLGLQNYSFDQQNAGKLSFLIKELIYTTIKLDKFAFIN